jgi:glutathione peroxidase
VDKPLFVAAINSNVTTVVDASIPHKESAMKTLVATLGLMFVVSGLAIAADKGDSKVPPVLNFKMKSLDGKDVDLSQYQGKVVMFVNVASKCGYTPQYKGLQDLHDKYADKGLVIIGVPANEFGKQEPGTDTEISEFCTSKYGVKFPMLSKVVVKGDGMTPLYKLLTEKETNPKFAGEIGWNFTKFVVGRNGEIVARFEPKIKPESEDVVKTIEAELNKK